MSTLGHSLGLRQQALVQLDDVVADEPDQVGEVGCGRLAADVLQHGRVVHCGRDGRGVQGSHTGWAHGGEDLRTLVDVEGEGSDRDAHHALTVVEELDGLCVEGKVPQVLQRVGNSRWSVHCTTAVERAATSL